MRTVNPSKLQKVTKYALFYSSVDVTLISGEFYIFATGRDPFVLDPGHTNYCILTITDKTFLCPHLLLLCILFILYPSVVITWLDFISSENVKQKNPGRQSLRGQSMHSKLQEKYRFPVRVAMETTCRTCSWVRILTLTPTTHPLVHRQL